MKKITIALAGNANVGKSALFNYLTGLHQHVGNWPGKTVERAEGTLRFDDYEIDVIDLPGIYSFSTFSIEETISRDHIAKEKPDVVVNVVNSTALERNLFFTLQLVELGAPLVLALNQIDVARRSGITIDAEKLGKLLGAPVVETIATTGFGVKELIEKCIEVAESGKKKRKEKEIRYGREVEGRIKKVTRALARLELEYPARYVAIKILEDDEGIRCELASSAQGRRALSEAGGYAREIKKIHGEPSSIVVRNERYNIANRLAGEVQKLSSRRAGLAEKIDELTTHGFLGYVIMLAVLGLVFYSIFAFGNTLSTAMGDFLNSFRPQAQTLSEKILWEVVFGGFVAGITLVIPYVLPFYFLLSLLEDTGYIARIAYLLDGVAHRVGFHGKAIIPLILGYGCNVPACFSCRLMEYQRDRLITAFAVTLVPCTARTIVILALVGAYVGIEWALAIYLFDIVLIALLSRLAFAVLPGEPMGLIMEMPAYRLPSLRAIAKHTWGRIRSLITLVFPSYVLGGVLLAALALLGALEMFNDLLAPVIVDWLGLPKFVGALLVFGIVRKELIVVLPVVLFGTTNFSALFSPLQMVVLALVAMLYIPCLATVLALRREFGWAKALAITVFEVALAFFVGGLAARALGGVLA
ncbi:MAG: ferrous iron transport protein B [Candidatus Micrarchaeota archaeon]